MIKRKRRNGEKNEGGNTMQRKPNYTHVYNSLKKRRAKPRRGRVIDKDFVAWMHTQPCLVRTMARLCSGPITFHHVREFGSPKDDRRGLALCTAHHLHCYEASIHRLGKIQFQRTHGVNIEAAIADYNERYEQERAA